MKQQRGRLAIADCLQGLRERNEKALVLFVTAGYPQLNATTDIILAAEEGGADIIELGMPFSDPLADGPVIQECSATAIRNGMTLIRTLEAVASLRKRSSIPLVLMGYINPIIQYGIRQFFLEASEAGVDGIILPEVPLEEQRLVSDDITRVNLANILLVAPTSSKERIEAIDKVCTGFLYCVSSTAVTGNSVKGSQQDYVRRVKSIVQNNSVFTGFGIQTPEQAKVFADACDGVIIGSAFLRHLKEDSSREGIITWVQWMKSSLRSNQRKAETNKSK
jgi:tryptophan synthase alpha chain